MFVRESKKVAELCAVVFEPLIGTVPVTFNVSVVTQDGLASEIYCIHPCIFSALKYFTHAWLHNALLTCQITYHVSLFQEWQITRKGYISWLL